ncbi:cadherin-like domain-containing protein [Microvirga makkahensis]|uniref:Cadherin-like domain-containing protein n=1 Tax=Microvirga makkahensis TaxID=1128670 RepID=A0A7X3SNE4_9HYPH|nr:cadherin-like domain-containing protein [Microvirga makkahensis]MXQ11135.1 hypothetical protein [Microvirga makkahensis]
MIIDVKGTRSESAGKSAGAKREDYAPKEVKPSKVPLVLGAMILGLAAYLKSALQSWGRLPPEDEAPVQPEEAGGSRLKLIDTGMLSEPLGPHEQGDHPSGDDVPRRIGSGTPYDARLEPAEFMEVDAPSFHFPLLFNQKADVSGTASFGRPLLVANDNVAPGHSSPSHETDGSDTPPPGDDHTEKDRPAEKPPTSDEGDDEPPRPSVNRPPRTSGPVYLQDVAGCGVFLIVLSDLLRNVSDPDGDALSIRNLKVSSGTITWTEKGLLYDPNGLGPVTVTYEVTDGRVTIVQHAYFSVVRNSVTGTDGDDVLLGTGCADIIEARAGNDLIDGRSGDDILEGGAGGDHIIGGAGDDIIRGGDGNDIVLGGAGNDQISGGEGADRLFGDDGNDIIFGDAGSDQIHGGSGDDVLFGGSGNDLVEGDGGDDRIEGGAGGDILRGGDGDDVVAGGLGHDSIDGGAGADVVLDGAGSDTVSGGSGDDHVIVALDGDRDLYDGGAGTDTLDLSHAGWGVEVDLQAGTANGSEIGRNQAQGFEVVRGGSAGDTIAGSDGGETISGGDGDDQLLGRDGNDSLDGGAGDDTIWDGTGQDVVSGGNGNDIVFAAPDGVDDVYDGGEACDTLDYSASENGVLVDLAAGNASGGEVGNDTIRGFEIVIGGSGADHFIVGSSPTAIKGGAGDDLFEYLPLPNENAAAPVLHEIIDFEVGDRIRMSKYDIFEEVLDQLEDKFTGVYGNKIDEDDVRIRYRHERTDEIDRTVIEADLDRDANYETTIHIDGYRAFIIVEHA